jgi:autotransporter-associated beta strand protein
MYQTSNLTFSGTMRDKFGGAGNFSLIKQGLGTMTLLGNNITYTGTTEVANGVLQLGNGNTSVSLNGSLPTASITVGSNGALYINENTTTAFTNNVVNNGILAGLESNNYYNTFSGIISGTGTLQQLGAGTTILTGNNTLSGGAFVTNGTLILGNGSSLYGTIGGTIVIASNGKLGINLASGGTFTNSVTDYGSLLGLAASGYSNLISANISGTGSFIQAGVGMSVLSGSNTFSGGTYVTNGGTLQVGNGSMNSTLGSGAVTNQGYLVFNEASNSTVTNLISGTGTLVQAGTGTLNFASSNSMSGAVKMSNSSSIIVSTNGALGTADLYFLGTNMLAATTNVSLSNNVSLSQYTNTFNVAGGNTLTFTRNFTNNAGVTSYIAVTNSGVLFLNPSSGSTVLPGPFDFISGTTMLGGSITQPNAYNVIEGTNTTVIFAGTFSSSGSVNISTKNSTDKTVLIINSNANVTFSSIDQSAYGPAAGGGASAIYVKGTISQSQGDLMGIYPNSYAYQGILGGVANLSGLTISGQVSSSGAASVVDVMNGGKINLSASRIDLADNGGAIISYGTLNVCGGSVIVSPNITYGLQLGSEAI